MFRVLPRSIVMTAGFTTQLDRAVRHIWWQRRDQAVPGPERLGLCCGGTVPRGPDLASGRSGSGLARVSQSGQC